MGGKHQVEPDWPTDKNVVKKPETGKAKADTPSPPKEFTSPDVKRFENRRKK